MLPENDIQKNVLEKIRTGEVSMHSRSYFTFREILIDGGVVLVSVLSLFVLSFLFFSIQQSDQQYLLTFGGKGTLAFLELFPWLALLLSIALLISLEALLRHFTFGYRLPALRLFLFAILVGIAGSVVVGLTPLHAYLLGAAEQERLPGVISSLYNQALNSEASRGIYRGTVISLSDSQFVIVYADGVTSWIIVPPDGFDMRTLSLGDRLYIAGQPEDDLVYAYGIRRLTDD